MQTAVTDPTVMIVFTSENGSRSFLAFDERGEVIETNTMRDSNGHAVPDWSQGGICDSRGAGSAEGFKALHDALTSAEKNAQSVGMAIQRIAA
jgi:hypothetical protein